MEIKVLASGSTGNCYRISDGRTTLLLDAGIPLNAIRKGCDFKLSDVSGALVTHRHNDHSKAVCDLVKCGINVYALSDVFIAKHCDVAHRCMWIEKLADGDKILYEDIFIGSLMVTPFKCHHDVPNIGFYIHSRHTGENLLYFTDTYYIEPIFSDLHYIMAEANYSAEALNKNIASGAVPAAFKKRLVQSHMSIDNLLDMLQANDLSKVRQIYLMHLSDNNSREDEFKRKVQEATGCEVYVC